MKIASVSTEVYRIPCPVTLSDSTHGSISSFELLVVDVMTDEGVAGMGYSYLISGMRAVKALTDDLIVGLLLGQDPFATEKIWDEMWWAAHFVGRGGASTIAMAAVDVALWDLKGRAIGRSLGQLLGGCRDRVETYAGGVDLYFSLDELLDQAKRYLDQGFRAIKMKVGRDDPREDVSRVEAMRAALGDHVTLMVDANMKWTVPQAIQMGDALRPFGLYWMEEPTIPDDVAGHARIASAVSIPIAAGENLYTKHEFQRYLEAGALGFAEPDVARVGGITEWMKVASLAASHNVSVTSHGVDELHVHLLAAIPNASYLERHSFRVDDYLLEPFPVEDGYVRVPERPGHGVAFDMEKLAPLRVE